MRKRQQICPFQGGLGEELRKPESGLRPGRRGRLNSQKHHGENGSGIWGPQSILFPCAGPELRHRIAVCPASGPRLLWAQPPGAPSPQHLTGRTCSGLPGAWGSGCALLVDADVHSEQTVQRPLPPAWRKLCSHTNVVYLPWDCSPQTVSSLAHTHTRATPAPSEHLGKH